MKCSTDIPYLEDLVLYLKSNTEIQKLFPAIGSVKLAIGLEGLKDMLKKDCPFNRAIFIYPSSMERENDKNSTCAIAKQTLGIVLVRKCNGKHFEFEKDGTEIDLAGDFMDLACMRKTVLDEMKCFKSDRVIDLYWKKTLETITQDCLLVSGLEFVLTFSI